MTDQEIVDGLINRDEKITDWFFNIKYRPLFINVIKLIFDYQVDYDECISETGVCCEHLCTVQNIFVTIQNSCCLLHGGVCTRTGLCQTECTDFFALCQGYQIFLFLFFCTECHNRIDTCLLYTSDAADE